jgi:DDE family transposase
MAGKWNNTLHQLFSFISINWRAIPLISLEVVIRLISGATNDQGLTVTAVKDSNSYPTGIKITKKDMKALNIVRDSFHGDWNVRLVHLKP